MVRKIVLSLVAVLSMCMFAFAQNRQVSGIVLGTDGSPITGATVLVDGTTVGTSTDVDGRFVITARKDATLVVSFLGYVSQRVAVGGKTQLEIILKEDAQAIDEVTITAFGEIKKKDFTGSISSVSSKDIGKATVSSVSNALVGAVSGIQTLNGSGQPGEDSFVMIRGEGSINAGNGALVVVDGVPYGSSLSTLNPADIESVVVSKDAAANALYGSRAAGGVIFVKMKKGAREQKANITFEAKWGWNELGYEEHPVVTNPGDYYEYVYGSLYNGIKSQATPGMSHLDIANQAYSQMWGAVGNYMTYTLPEGEKLIDFETGHLNPNAKLLYHDDYKDEFFKKSFRQEYSLSISGGNETMDYFISSSFLEDPSYAVMSSFKRYSGRAAFNARATKWLNIGANFNYSRRDVDAPGSFNGGTDIGNPNLWINWLMPLVPYYAYDENGQRRLNPDGSYMLETGNGTTYSPMGATQSTIHKTIAAGAAPMDVISRNVHNAVVDEILVSTYADINFLKDFKFTFNFTMQNIRNAKTLLMNNEYGQFAQPEYNGIINKSASTGIRLTTQQMLTYHKLIADKHDLNVLVGHEYSKDDSSSLSASNKNMFYPGVPELDNAIANNGTASSSRGRSASEGYFTRLNYAYDGRYNVSFSYRYDGSSSYKYNRWGHFWSIGGAWNMEQEDFLKDHRWINSMKLRANYGVTGHEYGAYAYTTMWGIGDAGGNIALGKGAPGYRDLTWEKVYQFDLGLDFRFWNRFSGTLDFYTRRTHDLIWSRPVAPSTGLSSRLDNVGILANNGFEFELGVDIIKTQNVYWNVAINGATVSTFLKEFPSDIANDPRLNGCFQDGPYLRGKNKPYRNWYFKKYAGVDPQTGRETFWKKVSEDITDADGNVIGSRVLGHERTYDFNEGSYYEIGDQMPDVTGGLRTSFRWKGFDFMLVCAYQIGGLQMDSSAIELYSPNRFGFNISKDLVRNTWTPENPYATFPKAQSNAEWMFRSTDASLRDASYFFLKTVNIGYTLPQKWTRKFNVESLRIFFSGDNLWMKSVYDGFDPRMNGGSSEFLAFRQPRTFTFGVTLNM